jgi:hypothetical protein
MTKTSVFSDKNCTFISKVNTYTKYLVGTSPLINMIYSSFRKETLQFASPLRAHQMSWAEFVYLFVYFWKVLEPLWKRQENLNLERVPLSLYAPAALVRKAGGTICHASCISSSFRSPFSNKRTRTADFYHKSCTIINFMLSVYLLDFVKFQIRLLCILLYLKGDLWTRIGHLSSSFDIII